MIEMQSVFVDNGYWYSYYEPSDMRGVMLRTRYELTPIDNGGMLSSGKHKGMIIGDGSFEGKLLRIVSGGECLGSSIVNPALRDFKFRFDDEYHDEYKAGATRGFTGKRACSHIFYYQKSDPWRAGYDEGRRVRLELIERSKLPF